MTEDLLSKFTPEEREGVHRIQREAESGQRTEDPGREFARRLRDRLWEEELKVSGNEEDSAAIEAARVHLEQARLGMPLRKQAEDIRALVEARAKYDDQEAMRQVSADRDKGVLVTKLWMQMRVERQSEEETINLGIVVGTDRDNEDGTVSISSLLIKRDQAGGLVESQHIEAKILPGGRLFIRENVLDLHQERHKNKYSNTYSVVYPWPDQGGSKIGAIVADGEEASILLKRLKRLVDRCLTQPNSSFYRQKDISRRALSK